MCICNFVFGTYILSDCYVQFHILTIITLVQNTYIKPFVITYNYGYYITLHVFVWFTCL